MFFFFFDNLRVKHMFFFFEVTSLVKTRENTFQQQKAL